MHPPAAAIQPPGRTRRSLKGCWRRRRCRRRCQPYVPAAVAIGVDVSGLRFTSTQHPISQPVTVGISSRSSKYRARRSQPVDHRYCSDAVEPYQRSCPPRSTATAQSRSVVDGNRVRRRCPTSSTAWSATSSPSKSASASSRRPSPSRSGQSRPAGRHRRGRRRGGRFQIRRYRSPAHAVLPQPF